VVRPLLGGTEPLRHFCGRLRYLVEAVRNLAGSAASSTPNDREMSLFHFGRICRWASLCLVVALSACSHRLSETACNAALAAWNQFDAEVAEYDGNVKSFQKAVETTARAPQGSTNTVVAHVNPSVIKAVLNNPSFSTSGLESFPGVQSKIQDVATDYGVFSRNVGKARDSAAVTGDDEVALVIAPPTSGAVAFESIFGQTLGMKRGDYLNAVTTMRNGFTSLCGGDPSQIRDVGAEK
jgi:hypothetical protein